MHVVFVFIDVRNGDIQRNAMLLMKLNYIQSQKTIRVLKSYKSHTILIVFELAKGVKHLISILILAAHKTSISTQGYSWVYLQLFHGCSVDVSNIVWRARTSGERVVAASVACLTASL